MVFAVNKNNSLKTLKLKFCCSKKQKKIVTKSGILILLDTKYAIVVLCTKIGY